MNKLAARENEILELTQCKINLDNCLRNSRKERDRQHHQIIKLTTLKIALTEEVQSFGMMQKESKFYEQDLALKIAEVTELQEGKEALMEEMKALREEMDVRNIEVIK